MCTQFYDLTPIEFKQNKAVDPQRIRAINIDKGWYLKQLKLKCANAVPGKEIAELLMRLNKEDLTKVMKEGEFNMNLLRECMLLANNYMKSSDVMEDRSFFESGSRYLLQRLSTLVQRCPKKHEVSARLRPNHFYSLNFLL